METDESQFDDDETFDDLLDDQFVDHHDEHIKPSESMDEFLSEFGSLGNSRIIEKVAGFFSNYRGESPIAGFVTHLLFAGYILDACELCIEPSVQEFRIGIRPRSTGAWTYPKNWAFPRGYYRAVIGRLKVIGQLDVAEHRLAQEGGFTVKTADQEIAIAIHTLPCDQGEIMTLRFVNPPSLLIAFEDLNMPSSMGDSLDKLFESERHGMILVGGSSQDGTSATVSAIARRYMQKTDKLIAVTDTPQLYPDATNVKIDNRVGMSAATIVRNLKTHRPSIVVFDSPYSMNYEVSYELVRLAEIGTIVLCTQAVQTAPDGFRRLVDMGIEDYLVTSIVRASINQRLVRLLCPHCKEASDDSEYPARAVGCVHCFNSGYSGHRCVFDSLFVDEHDAMQLRDWEYVNNLISNSHSVRRAACLELANQGLTSGTEAICKS